MTTLRSFQAEIEHFSHEKQKQAIKEAREAHIAAEAAKHHKKHEIKHEVKEVMREEDHQEHNDDEGLRIEVRAHKR